MIQEGQIFGGLKVLQYQGNNKYLCECMSCGKTYSAYASNIPRNKVGCKDCKAKAQITHGCSKTQLYELWGDIRKRCANPKASRFEYYGGKGISVCEEWQDFSNFKKWCEENGYQQGLTIGRIDINKSYSPENCRIVPLSVDCNNRSSNRVYTYNGKTQTLMQWCTEFGLKYSVILQRITRSHWTFEEAVELVPRKQQRGFEIKSAKIKQEGDSDAVSVK